MITLHAEQLGGGSLSDLLADVQTIERALLNAWSEQRQQRDAEPAQ